MIGQSRVAVLDKLYRAKTEGVYFHYFEAEDRWVCANGNSITREALAIAQPIPKELHDVLERRSPDGVLLANNLRRTVVNIVNDFESGQTFTGAPMFEVDRMYPDGSVTVRRTEPKPKPLPERRRNPDWLDRLYGR
jgi:hypothetical protein